MLGVSTLMMTATWWQWWTISMTETLGFVTGGLCVWLIVREHWWNWPIGLMNNLFFASLFWNSRLYADMALQFLFAALAVYGWWNWTANRSQGSTNPSMAELGIERAKTWEWFVIAIFLPAGTLLLAYVLHLINGAAPFWDATTTILSLIAQYLLTRKRIENWYFWILADVIYIPLYISRDLTLTAILYGCFLVMCLIGLRTWNQSLSRFSQ